MVEDSPRPDVALLATERLPAAIRELQALGRDAAQTEAAARAVAEFRQRWMSMADREVSILPNMAAPAPAADMQQRVLGSMVASASLLACGWLFAVVCLVLIVVVLATRTFGPVPLIWRWGGRGAMVAPAIVVVPALVTILVACGGGLPFVWLLSLRSLGGAVLLLVVTILTWMLATQVCVRSTDPAHESGLPWPALLGGAVFVALVVVAVAVLFPPLDEPWRPPLAVQLFRRLGGVAGLASIPVLLVWAWQHRSARRRANLPAGVWARACLAVASSTMVLLLCAAVIGLTVNSRRDAAHDAAFLKAAADPIADRLGPQWFETHFAPARQLLGS
jgi:hypothetical protein